MSRNALSSLGRCGSLGAAFDLLIQPLKHIGAFEMFMVLPQTVKGQVSSMFSSTHAQSLRYFSCQRNSQAARSLRASSALRRS